MIPRTRPQNTDWKAELRQAITNPETLLDIIELPKSKWLANARQASRLFPLKAPRNYVQRIEKGNPYDPLLRQILPLGEELINTPGFSTDPVGDQLATSEAGLIHKYHGRALIITTGACAIHCRYCFRRHFPYADSHSGGGNLTDILSYLRQHTELNEVILSGGDPLMLDDKPLFELFEQIFQLPHIQWIRLHSRLPVVLPERINKAFLQALSPYQDKTILVIHSNHAREIDDSVGDALERIAQLGVRLFNQSVLLKGVNDEINILVQLSQKLFQHRVQPYYLHCLDRVAGASHFDIDETTAIQLHQAMQSRLPGYLVPRLVREIAGKSSKTLI